jgi:Spy/CpxP family protein refolding chaperone
MLVMLAVSSPAWSQRTGQREVRRLPVERLAEHLDLTRDQVDQLKAIDRERAVQLAELRTRESLLRYDMQELMAAEPIQQSAVFAKLDEIGAVRTEMAKVRFSTRIRIKQLLGDKIQPLMQLLERGARSNRRASRQRPDRRRAAPRSEERERAGYDYAPAPPEP